MDTKYINQKGYSFPIPVIVGALMILGFGAGMYYFSSKQTVSQQSSSAIVAASQTPAPSLAPKDETANPDSIGANWKTYTNTEAKVSLRYPSDWKVEVKQPDGESKRISIKGKEGNILLDYGSGFGGACQSAYEDFNIGNAQTKACHSTLVNGSEEWSLSDMKKSDKSDINDINYGGFVTANAPFKNNRDIILKILSTFKFTN